jgi:hypothetical protein
MIKHKNNKLDNINFKNRKHYVQQHENRNTDSPPVYWRQCD